jgi:hypothetical protein
MATFDNEKRDDTPRRKKKKEDPARFCWPDEALLTYLGEFTFRDGVLVDQVVP